MKHDIVKWSFVSFIMMGAGHGFASNQPLAGEALQDISVESDWIALSDELLDSLRGGFDLGAGLKVSFGFMRSIAINGEQVSRISFNFPDLKNITPDQARFAGEAMAQAGVVQVGRGNVVLDSDSGSSGVRELAGTQAAMGGATIIQNSLNNQQISTLTEINTAVNSLGMIKSMNARSTLQEALLGSLNVR